MNAVRPKDLYLSKHESAKFFEGSAPNPAGELTAPPDPQLLVTRFARLAPKVTYQHKNYIRLSGQGETIFWHPFGSFRTATNFWAGPSQEIGCQELCKHNFCPRMFRLTAKTVRYSKTVIITTGIKMLWNMFTTTS